MVGFRSPAVEESMLRKRLRNIGLNDFAVIVIKDFQKSIIVIVIEKFSANFQLLYYSLRLMITKCV